MVKSCWKRLKLHFHISDRQLFLSLTTVVIAVALIFRNPGKSGYSTVGQLVLAALAVYWVVFLVSRWQRFRAECNELIYFRVSRCSRIRMRGRISRFHLIGHTAGTATSLVRPETFVLLMDLREETEPKPKQIICLCPQRWWQAIGGAPEFVRIAKLLSPSEQASWKNLLDSESGRPMRAVRRSGGAQVAPDFDKDPPPRAA